MSSAGVKVVSKLFPKDHTAASANEIHKPRPDYATAPPCGGRE